MQIGITGASGFIGRRIVDLALRRGHEVIAFSRTPARGLSGCEMRLFNVEEPPDLTGCEAIIHLAGESVSGLWTKSKKRRVWETRIHGTRRMVEAIDNLSTKPEVFVCASAIGIYGDCGNEKLVETSTPGDGYFPALVEAWEREALSVRNVRAVTLRTAMALGLDGGALKPLIQLFRKCLGGRLGTGRQWMSWIHIDDLAQLYLFCVENMDVFGPVNASAPWPVQNGEFTRTLATALRRPAFLNVPSFALRILGEFRHELLDSKRVLPAVATDNGFGFHHPDLKAALDHLIR